MWDGCDILLIGDNDDDVKLIREAYRKQGGNGSLRVLADNTEAVDCMFGPRGCLAQTPVPLPRLILLDLKLPQNGGLDILKRMKSDRRTCHIPVVVLTASDEPQDRTECYRHGANSYIVKPAEAGLFSRYAADIISYWATVNRTAYVDH